MRVQNPPPISRIAAMLRQPATWIALAVLIMVAAATAAVAVELYASTSVPMVLNPR